MVLLRIVRVVVVQVCAAIEPVAEHGFVGALGSSVEFAASEAVPLRAEQKAGRELSTGSSQHGLLMFQGVETPLVLDASFNGVNNLKLVSQSARTAYITSATKNIGMSLEDGSWNMSVDIVTEHPDLGKMPVDYLAFSKLDIPSNLFHMHVQKFSYSTLAPLASDKAIIALINLAHATTHQMEFYIRNKVSGKAGSLGKYSSQFVDFEGNGGSLLTLDDAKWVNSAQRSSSSKMMSLWTSRVCA